MWYKEILAIRKGMWTAVKERSHNPVKIFPFGNTDEEGRQELMLYGDVAYVFKDGRAAKVCIPHCMLCSLKKEKSWLDW